MMLKTSSHFFKLLAILTLLLNISVEAICPLPGTIISETRFDPNINFSEPQIVIDDSGNAIAIWSEGNATTFASSINYATHAKGGNWSPSQPIPNIPGFVVGPQIAIGGLSGNAVAVWVQFDFFSGIPYLVSSQRPFATGVWSDYEIIGRSASGGSLPTLAMNDSDQAIVVWVLDDDVNKTLTSAELSFGGTWTNTLSIQSLTDSVVTQKVALDPSGVAYAVWIDPATNQVVASIHSISSPTWSTPLNLSTGGNQTKPDVAAGSGGFAIATWSSTSDFVIYSIEASAFQTISWGSAVTINSPLTNSGAPVVAVDSANNGIVLWRDTGSGSSVFSAYRHYLTGIWDAPLQVSIPGLYSFGPDVAFDGLGVAHAVWSASIPGGVDVEYATANGSGPWSTVCDAITAPDETNDLVNIAVDPTGYAVIDWLNTSLNAIQATFTPLSPIVSSIVPSSGTSEGGNTVIINGTSFDGTTAVLFGGVPALSFTQVSSSTIVAVAPPGVVGTTVNVTVTTGVGTSPTVPGDLYTYTAPICWQR